MSIGSSSPVRKVVRHIYQTDRLGKKKNHPLLLTAKVINRVASRQGLRFEGWDETAGSLSWKVSRGLRNGNKVAIEAANQVVLKAAIVNAEGVERIAIGLREEIVDLPVDASGTKGALSKFNWRVAFALRPQSKKFFLQLESDLATLEQRLDAALRELFGFDPDRAIPDVLADEEGGHEPSVDDQLLQAAVATAGRSASESVIEEVSIRAEETPADRTRFGLKAEQWRAFLEALDAPPRDLPRLQRLFQEPSVIERGIPE